MATLPKKIFDHSHEFTKVQAAQIVAVSRPRPLRCDFVCTQGVEASVLRSFPYETEDSLITGGTRSLGRRLLALNLEGSLRRKSAAPVVASWTVLPAPKIA
jgi:hypothetical protein